MDLRPPPCPPPPPEDWELATRELIELVKRCQAGDARAFATLQRRFYTPILKFARVRFPDLRDAEDMAVEIFLNVYRSLPSLTNPKRFVRFLFGIARNLCNAQIETSRRRTYDEVSLEEVHASGGALAELPAFILPGPGEFVEREETRRLLWDAIAQLAAPERESLLLHYQEELSYVQISRMLDVTTETVRYRVRRARHQLVSLLPPEIAS